MNKSIGFVLAAAGCYLIYGQLQAGARKIRVDRVNYATGEVVFTTGGRQHKVNAFTWNNDLSIASSSGSNIAIKVERSGSVVKSVWLETYNILPCNIKEQHDVQIIGWKQA